ncbi:MurR/RpiR family transcriptional regulator [Agrobacterium vitis]|uniref:SIS domain-containing protein n=1 Tax=Agrobacterium vitis TaxID=373 RepID=A0AAE4WEL8_AGRVI|nr:MurR/RpiR family transcriptional regulator [Agrobacterium vitis]MCF1501232.1 MurR/RpiR family transcriptional regulator [Allorhizobium sp. Av2]MCM2440591.1 MurR/RpiR family transcriptional regulator [Agrobacterium vitis]MUZ59577.1 SIS domain-containing protein [Agrobacterium vitis]MVA66660.1 SIS domain-containing protein [Agrobacterium vitis]MVA87523.1 SIS domain-containing protein [Agrobacterium vitis]
MGRQVERTGKSRRIDRYGERLKKRRDQLSPGLLTVADYIDGHRHAVLSKSALEIAFETSTSDATVIRAIQALGFRGLLDLKETLKAYLGETDSPIEKMAATTDDISGNSDAAVDFVLENQQTALAALASPENRAALSKAALLMAEARAIGVFGIGASGIIASYGARLFSRSGFPSYALNTTGISLAEQLLGLGTGHVLVMLLHGRPHREAMTVISEAKRLDIPLILVLGQTESVLRQHASVSLVVPRAKSEHVALHAPSLVVIETLALALSALKPERTLETLNRLVELRSTIRPDKRG